MKPGQILLQAPDEDAMIACGASLARAVEPGSVMPLISFITKNGRSSLVVPYS